MNIIELSREIGKEIQKDDRYLAFQLAKQNTETDEALQKLIGEFNLKRLDLQHESEEDSRDPDRLHLLNQELRELYQKIMENPRMAAYNRARESFNYLLNRVNAIISQSAEGGDPETVDLTESSCGGDCSACGGCR